MENDNITIIKEIIFDLYGIQVNQSSDILFNKPYSLKAYDIIYILFELLKIKGLRNATFTANTLDDADFSTIDGISKFLNTLTIDNISV